MVSIKNILVVGATGATGRHVVRMLLEEGHQVRTIVRSQERMESLLTESGTNMDKLTTTEASLLDMPETELQTLVDGCDAVVSCLGHNPTFEGIFGHPRRLVTDATKRLTTAMAKSKETGTAPSRFILMNSGAVVNPNGQDDRRPFGERLTLSLLRNLIPAHADNEQAALYLSKTTTTMPEWCAVRPDNLIDVDTVTPYTVAAKPTGPLFGTGTSSRVNTADFMTKLILDDKLWEEWKFQMPAMLDKVDPNDGK